MKRAGRHPTASFQGYRRTDGRVGVRNFLAVTSVMDTSNPVVRRIAAQVQGSVALCPAFGRGQVGEDDEQHVRTLSHLVSHANVGAALVVSLEPKSAEQVAERVSARGVPVEVLSIQGCGGTVKTTAEGVRRAQALAKRIAREGRVRCELSEVTVGLECGGSDTTSGLVANPALGWVADRVVEAGGRACFSETVEVLGAEHILARRAASPGVRRELLAAVRRYEDYAASLGIDLVGSNPAADNIAGGLTTIEEKSLGAIKKGGSSPLQEVIGYGHQPTRRGLIFLDAPAAGVENLTALAAAGAQVCLFATGVGNTIGNPVSPTLKVTGNPNTADSMAENIDVDLRGVVEGTMSLEEAGGLVLGEMLAVLNGKLTQAEILGETETTISRAGLSI